jgi:hypothetical protein
VGGPICRGLARRVFWWLPGRSGVLVLRGQWAGFGSAGRAIATGPATPPRAGPRQRARLETAEKLSQVNTCRIGCPQGHNPNPIKLMAELCRSREIQLQNPLGYCPLLSGQRARFNGNPHLLASRELIRDECRADSRNTVYDSPSNTHVLTIA